MNTNHTTWIWILLTAMVAGVAGYLLASNSQPAPSPKTTVVEAKTSADIELKLPESYLASSNILVEQVAAGDIAAEMTTSGRVEAMPGGEASVIAKVAGTITRINKRLGDTVEAGETIAVVESFEAVAMTAERNTADAKVDLARKIYQRELSLFEQGVTPRQDMESAYSALKVAEVEAAKAALVAKSARVAANGNSVLVVSPLKGKISAESGMVGIFVQPDVEIFRVVSNQQLQILAFITAAELSRVKVGDAATVITRNGSKITAKVRSVTPSVSGANQTATAILTSAAQNPPYVLGEGLQITLHSHPDKDTGLIIPEEAIQRLDGQDVVFIRTKEGFKPQSVAVGIRSGGEAQILSGIEQNARIATQNAFLLKAELIKNATAEEE